MRVKRRRNIDHIIPYWAGILMVSHLDARGVDLIGSIAVVGSCPDCNSKRQVRKNPSQLVNEAMANVELVRLQRLFVERVLIDADVDPVNDGRRFLKALGLLRSLLTTGRLAEPFSDAV